MADSESDSSLSANVILTLEEYRTNSPSGSEANTPKSSDNVSINSSLRPSKLDRKESYKAQRKNYAKEKKRVERELQSSFKDESIIVRADWLKVRGSLKSWCKLWCVVKPGLLLLYKSPKVKSSHWIGTIILSTCELIERPSKKDGFCFKLFHPMDQSIWASKGPNGETIGAVVQPLPNSHLIFRAPNNATGKCWMDALELALRCSSLLLRTMSKKVQGGPSSNPFGNHLPISDDNDIIHGLPSSSSTAETLVLNESDSEKHFISGRIKNREEDQTKPSEDDDDDDDEVDIEEEDDSEDEESDDTTFREEPSSSMPEPRTQYVCDAEVEVFGSSKDQTEEFSDENKSIVWFLVKQVRPGMDLSKVVLPSFILEPRSFLDKMSDYYYHGDLLSEAVANNEPFMRMKSVVKWYLSGLYKKPKGLKKPYNPILGETFRCYWEHPNGSQTFYLAEQVSHHPPISAFYVSNRQDGITISSSICTKSKFYGNSTSALLEGTATLCLLPRGEDYKMTLPYAHCKGILMGTLTMELAGKVMIECEKTGYSTEIEFKLRPMLGGDELTNKIVGKMKLGSETICSMEGHWDDIVIMKDRRTGEEEILWSVSPEIRARRLKRYTVPLDNQRCTESVRLWKKVSDAILADDQKQATEEKAVLEHAQRAAAKERKDSGDDWVPKYFELDPISGQYIYKHADHRPWDPSNDMYTYEYDMILKTKTKHRTPMVRTQSIISVSNSNNNNINIISSSIEDKSLDTQDKIMSKSVCGKRKRRKQSFKDVMDSPDIGSGGIQMRVPINNGNDKSLREALYPMEDQQRNMSDRLDKLQRSLDLMMRQQKDRDTNSNLNRDMVLLVILVVMIQAVLNWILSTRAQQYDPSPGH
ncbi:oxysterol-binding protein-related protein 8 isoform X3 [Lepeophtheirus salmonis]|uniref:oxysterol-binding protein-related protein 8 isoform X3 n=1 Tax=Lepeophtheirus salmonis TaxID=72036 RepID=UPI001AE1712B|nr:oxysterol-binding protein-related protein 8-like isoform X3 [Lepeophtheirus salmonis]